MPGKYSCPKCGRRFTEWGAERYGFKCPGDEWCPKDRPEEIALVRVGMQDDAKPAKKPTLKRPTKRVVVTPSSMNEDEILVPDIEAIEADTDTDDDEIEEVEDDEEEVVVSGAKVSTKATDDDSVSEENDDVDDEDLEVDEGLEDAEDIPEEEWKA